MTPDDIRSQRFGTRLLRGLNPEEVTAFLEDVADAFDNIQRRNAALQAQTRVLQEKIQAFTEKPSSGVELRAVVLQELEALLHDAREEAQSITDAAQERAAAMLRDTEALKQQRQDEADGVVAGARATAESIVMAAGGKEAALRDEIERLTETRLRLLDDVRATLDRYHEWLTMEDPRRNGVLSTADETHAR